MSSRCTALLAEIDQRLGCWLGMEEDGEISGDDVVEETEYVHAGEYIEKLKCASVACEQNSNTTTVDILKKAWLSCVHAIDELTGFLSHTDDDIRMIDLNHLKRCLDGMRERVLQQMKPLAYVLWDARINSETWSSPRDKPLWTSYLEKRLTLVLRMNLYIDGLNSVDLFDVVLTLDSYSRFQLILDEVILVIGAIESGRQSVMDLRVVDPVALDSFKDALREDKVKIQALMKWTKALIEHNKLKIALNNLNLSNDNDSEDEHNVNVLDLLDLSIKEIKKSVNIHSYKECLAKHKREVFFAEISELQARIGALSIEFTYPNAESSNWREVLNQFTKRVELYETKLRSRDYRKEYISNVERLGQRLSTVMSKLQQSVDGLNKIIRETGGAASGRAKSDHLWYRDLLAGAVKLNERVGNLLLRLQQNNQ